MVFAFGPLGGAWGRPAAGGSTMTQHKHQKALIRARMARTGEAYTAARRHVVGGGDGATGRPLALAGLVEFRAHDRHCMTAVFSPDDRHVLTGGFGGQARIWTAAGAAAGELAGHTSSVNIIRVSDDGSTAVTASSDRTVRLWDLPERRERAVLGSHRRQVTALDLDARRGRAWSGGHDGSLRVWDLASGEALANIPGRAVVTSVAICPDDGRLAVGTLGGGLVIRSSEGHEGRRLAEEHEVVTAVTWSAEGSFLLASHPGGGTVWATDTWEVVRSLRAGGGMLPIAIAPDGSRVALGWDGHVSLWGPEHDEPAVVLDGLPKGVYGLAFSHAGDRLAMAAADGRVRIWEVS
jgi:WD40 repeat protein